MKYRSHNAARDSNEPAIVDALRKAGATVIRLDQPVDLLVGYDGDTWLLEVKLPLGPKGGVKGRELTPDQRAFIETWEGWLVQVVRTPEEALKAVGAIR